MPQFIDHMTGRTIEADGHRAAYYRRSPARFQEVGKFEDVEAAAKDAASRTVAVALAWAGDDPARRAALLEAEKAGKQRKGVLEALS